MIKGSAIRKATIKTRTLNKIVCTLPTKGGPTGIWNLKITNADKTTVTKTGAFTVKTGTSATGVETGAVTGQVRSMPVTDPLTALPGKTGSGIVGPVATPAIGS